MAKEPKKPRPKKPAGEKKGPYPSRKKVKYVGIPVEYWRMLETLTADGEEYEGRSVSFLGKLAVRAFLQAKGKLDEKGKPKPD